MQTTENLGLRKPEENDFFDVNDFNNNADALDALFEKDENGSVAAKNAKTLDGHGADCFAKAEINLGRINISESALDTFAKDKNITEYLTYIATIDPKKSEDGEYLFNGGRWTLIGMEWADYAYGHQLGIGDGTIKIRRLLNGTWGEWGEFLPLTGGKVNGNVTVSADDNSPRYLEIKNTTNDLALFASDNGDIGLRSRSKGKWHSYMDSNGKNTFNGTASGNLSLTGGRLDGYITFSQSKNVAGYGWLFKNNSDTSENGTQLSDVDNNGKQMRLTLDASRNWFKIKMADADNSVDILHTGNKPTGSYTGNGDATERRIATGGTGYICVVFGNSGIAFLTTSGCTIITASGATHSDEAYFTISGEIVLKTTNSLLNSGTCRYQVL